VCSGELWLRAFHRIDKVGEYADRCGLCFDDTAIRIIGQTTAPGALGKFGLHRLNMGAKAPTRLTHDERVAPTSPSALASQDGQIVVINGTSEWFRLRLGPKAVMDVHNLNWSPNRPDPGTGTTSPDAIRSVIQAKQ
jgi:hypothetical protein